MLAKNRWNIQRIGIVRTFLINMYRSSGISGARPIVTLSVSWTNSEAVLSHFDMARKPKV